MSTSCSVQSMTRAGQRSSRASPQRFRSTIRPGLTWVNLLVVARVNRINGEVSATGGQHPSDPGTAHLLSGTGRPLAAGPPREQGPRALPLATGGAAQGPRRGRLHRRRVGTVRRQRARRRIGTTGHAPPVGRGLDCPVSESRLPPAPIRPDVTRWRVLGNAPHVDRRISMVGGQHRRRVQEIVGGQEE